MNRYARDRRDSHYAPRVTKVTLSESHMTLRLLGAVVLLVLGGYTLAHTFSAFIGSSEGWQEIEIGVNESVNVSPDFTLYYNLGKGSLSSNQEKKLLQDTYTAACVEAWRIFGEDEGNLCEPPREDGQQTAASQSGDVPAYANLRDLILCPNEPLLVDAHLAEALQMLDAEGRYLYLGPFFEVLSNLYNAQSDTEAKEMDPFYDPETAAFWEEALPFIRDPESIRLSFEEKGDGIEATLVISEEYLEFIREKGIEAAVSLYPYRNAFTIDYLAEALQEAGFTNGMLASKDGMVRCLGESFEAVMTDPAEASAAETQGYILKNYTRDGKQVEEQEPILVSNASAVVSLRDFPLSDYDQYLYYVYEDGSIRSPWISPADGLWHTESANVYRMSDHESCGTLFVKLLAEYCDADRQ